jgi:hypothetical protein
MPDKKIHMPPKFIGVIVNDHGEVDDFVFGPTKEFVAKCDWGEYWPDAYHEELADGTASVVVCEIVPLHALVRNSGYKIVPIPTNKAKPKSSAKPKSKTKK